MVPESGDRRLKDGCGIQSTADWAHPRADDCLREVRVQWLKYIKEWRLPEHLCEHVSSRSSDPLLSDGEIEVLREGLVSYLRSRGFRCSSHVEPGQPLALEILHALLRLSGDMDGALPELLRDGVPTGIDEPIAPSGVWREVDVPEEVNGELHVFDSPWKSGLEDPELLMRMVQADVDMGFAEWLPGGLPQARERNGDRCAAGRLGLVCKDGADPRLIGDSTVSGANGRCCISEKIELPSLADVVDFVSRHDDEVWVGFILDVSKAHKRVLVAHGERGYSLFTVVDEDGQTHWLVYHTCHFGCAWAAYWWARVGGAFGRLAHRLLRSPHFLALYVDDLLCLLRRQFALPGACVLVMLACGLGIPLSLHKLRIGTSFRWIGWEFRLATPRCHASLPEDKRSALLQGLSSIARQTVWVSRKSVQSLVGKLVWFTSGARWLRPWLAVLFHLIHKPALRFASLSSCQLQSLVHSVDDQMRVRKGVRGAAVRVGWVVLEAQGSMLRDPEELLHCRLKNGRAWIKLADYDSSMVMVNEEEAGVARFLRGLLETSVCVPLVRRELKGLLCAADAYAEGDFAGLGGWWLLPGSKLELSAANWFSLRIHRSDLPQWFTQSCENGGLQQVICGLEALAQLLLLDGIVQDLGHDPTILNSALVSVRQRCDNMGFVCAAAKGMSLRQPLCGVLQSVSMFCLLRHFHLKVSHIPGEKNVWADALSRGEDLFPQVFASLDSRLEFEPRWQELLDLGQPPRV